MTPAGNAPRHAPPAYFGGADECLTIAGRPLTEIAAEVGRTPFYLYSRQALDARVAELRAILPREVHLHYAMKANPMPAVVRHMVGLTDGLDVASGREMRVALAAGAVPEHVSFAGPGKSIAELEEATAAGITVNAESELELRRLAQISERTGTRPRVAIRVNPDFELKSSGMRMSGGPKPFGIDAEQVPAVLSLPLWRALDFVGFHIFSGSQNLRAEAIIEAQQKSVELATHLATHAPAPVRRLNIGGGFGIPYFPGETPLDITPIGANLHSLLALCRKSLPGATLVIELGRYLVGEAGIYVCRVSDRKISRGQLFLITDGGLHHHLSASGNFGQVIRKNYPVLVANRMSSRERETASVVGPLCTPLDLLADKMELAPAQVGDLIVVLQSGAYGRTASPIDFLSHAPPEEILL